MDINELEIKTNTNLLKAKRIEFGYNQENMGDFLKISSISYGLKERGEYEFTQMELFTLILLLKLTPKDVNAIFFANQITDWLNKAEI